ncbi:winged helix-turn-helix transcriptional regulator [Pseudonocardia sp. ICBG1122]|nr:winged helix-turn-helix transcriptional regulator [Pseudonocardia pini]
MPTGQYERPWQRIAADLRDKITAGRWQAGDRLPPLAQLREQYGASHNTVLRAIRHLEADGLVTGKAGSGIYINETPQDG